ncbi:MAG: SAM-dependent methyltransferase [Bradymonadia bacterium]|jgi:SAM-dependent methyltransferase
MRTTPYHAGEHVADAGLTAEVDACPACGFTGERRRAHEIQRAPDLWLLECPQCGIASASRMPTPETLDAYYGRYYDPDGDKSTFSGLERFAAHLAAAIGECRSTGRLRVMDLGGGDGAVVAAACASLVRDGRATDIEVVLVDYESPTSEKYPGVTLVGERDLQQTEGSFDAIIASAILEHIPKVGPTLRTLFGKLRSGGTLYARTPYWVPLLRWLPKTDITFPGHVHDMGAPFWAAVPTTFDVDAEQVWCRPSIVETTLRDAPLRTAAAWLLKAPAHVEVSMRGPGVVPHWGYVGGWEALLRLR